MKYCETCKTGAHRQRKRYCFDCGTKLTDIPTEKCECGFKPYSHNAFCIKCGKPLRMKQFRITEIKETKDDIMGIIGEVIDKADPIDKEVDNS